MRDRLKQDARDLGIMLSESQLDQFEQYCTFLLETNRLINLTAIKQPEGVAIRHFVDSLTLLKVMDIAHGLALIDVGTGAGFPAVPLKIARPDLKVTLLDSLQKRLTFLYELMAQLGQDAVLVHARAEDGGKNPDLREKFDIATARAVAPLRMLAEYCLPFVAKGGRFAAMKGPAVQEELEAAKTAIAILGGEVTDVRTLSLSDGSQRSIIVVTKISQTPPQYPRSPGKMAKIPL